MDTDSYNKLELFQQNVIAGNIWAHTFCIDVGSQGDVIVEESAIIFRLTSTYDGVALRFEYKF